MTCIACIAIVRLWPRGRSCVAVSKLETKGQRGMDQQTVFWSLILCDLLLSKDCRMFDLLRSVICGQLNLSLLRI